MFEINDIVLMSYFLGLEIKQNEYGIHVSQIKYIEDLLKQFNMQNCKAVSVPMSPSAKLQWYENAENCNAGVYRCLIGKLLYVSYTGPDVMFVVSSLSRFMNKLTKIQFGAAKYVLRYLAGTMGFGIQYSSGIKCEIHGYADSDWGGDFNGIKSTLGVVFRLGSGVVSQQSKKQDVVALSSRGSNQNLV